MSAVSVQPLSHLTCTATESNLEFANSVYLFSKNVVCRWVLDKSQAPGHYENLEILSWHLELLRAIIFSLSVFAF
jgi:hypothetical protein